MKATLMTRILNDRGFDRYACRVVQLHRPGVNALVHVRGMGRGPMEAKRSRPEGYPKGQANVPLVSSFRILKGVGLLLASFAVTVSGVRGRPSRLVKQDCLPSEWVGSALRLGRRSRCSALFLIQRPHVYLMAATPFFIARNEGSSMVPDPYNCIHRINYTQFIRKRKTDTQTRAMPHNFLTSPA
jgi:hypothetical protein